MNKVCQYGGTAVFMGAESRNPKVVEMLLKAGADPFAQCDRRFYVGPTSVPKTRVLDFVLEDAIGELLMRDMRRRIAAAISALSAMVPPNVVQNIIRVAYLSKQT